MAKKEGGKITRRKRQFIEAYCQLIFANGFTNYRVGSDAARHIGLSGHSAEATASKWLNMAEVKEEITKYITNNSETMPKAELERAKNWAREGIYFNRADILKLDVNNRIIFDLAKIKEYGQYIKSTKFKDGEISEVTFIDQLAANKFFQLLLGNLEPETGDLNVVNLIQINTEIITNI